MSEEVRAGRRGGDPSLRSFARELKRLASAQQQQADAFAAHVVTDRERNGRIGKLEERAATSDAVLSVHLANINERGEANAKRLEVTADALMRLTAYAEGRRDLLVQIGQIVLKCWPSLVKALGVGVGIGGAGAAVSALTNTPVGNLLP